MKSGTAPDNDSPLSGYEECLVDDPVYLVDSDVVLTGSGTAHNEGGAGVNKPRFNPTVTVTNRKNVVRPTTPRIFMDKNR